MHTTIDDYMKRRFDTTRDESPFMNELIIKATGSIEGYPDGVSDKDIDRALRITMKRKMRTISPTINDIVWMNRHFHDIIDIPQSSTSIMRIDNLWTYLAGAVERRRHHQYTPINNNLLMRTTGWCHGDIVVGGEAADVFKAKNDLMLACMRSHSNKASMIPCVREWMPVGRQYEMGEGLSGQDNLKRIHVLRELTAFITDDTEYTPLSVRNIIDYDGMMQGWKAQSRNMTTWYEQYQPRGHGMHVGTAIALSSAKQAIDHELHHELINGKGEYRSDEDIADMIATIAGYEAQGIDETFIRQAIHMMWIH